MPSPPTPIGRPSAPGKPHERAASVFGPYVDKLMIPQLRELAGEYGVDGVWVDGDCWGTVPDYGATAVREFCNRTGAKAAPKHAGEPYWIEWMDFHREGFRRYVRHYVDTLKAAHPDFQVISNWAFSDHMPEAVSAKVAGLSGDFSPDVLLLKIFGSNPAISFSTVMASKKQSFIFGLSRETMIYTPKTINRPAEMYRV